MPGVEATATITIDFTLRNQRGRAASSPSRRSSGGSDRIGLADTPETVADAIAAFINADPVFCASATVAAGLSTTEHVVTLSRRAHYSARGNQLLIWRDDSLVLLASPIHARQRHRGRHRRRRAFGPLALAQRHAQSGGVQRGRRSDGSTISATERSAREHERRARRSAFERHALTKSRIDGGTPTITFSRATSSARHETHGTKRSPRIAQPDRRCDLPQSVTSGGTKVTITSDRRDAGLHVQVTGGTAEREAALNFSTTVADGSGNVSDVTAVTAAEWVTM